MRRLFLAPWVLVCFACDPEVKLQRNLPPALEFGYALDDQLRLNHIQMKGTHNSYHLRPEADPIDDHDYAHAPLRKQLEDQGVRQFEIDVHWDVDNSRFLVHHLTGADDKSTCPIYVDCLAELKQWSDEHRGHHPIFVFIEPKDEADSVAAAIGGRFELLEAETLSVIPRSRILAPDDVRGAAPTLQEAIATTGWPTLGELRGHFVFVILDRNREPDGHHYEYTHGNASLDGRLMFVTADPGDPYAAVLALDNPASDKETIHLVVQAGAIVRTRAADPVVDGVATSQADLAAALAGEAHIISTDYPVPGLAENYSLDLTGGTPSRCHPTLAPKGCRSEDVESEERLTPVSAAPR